MVQRKAAKLFLSTDCQETHEWFRKYYGEMLLTYDCEKKFKNNMEGTEHGVADLYLLARAKWILGTVHRDASLGGEWWIR